MVGTVEKIRAKRHKELEERLDSQKGQNKKQNTNHAIRIATKTIVCNARHGTNFVELSLWELIFQVSATINFYRFVFPIHIYIYMHSY